MTGNFCGQNDCESLEWVRERIHDKKHFTARSIAAIVDASGMEAELISKILSGVLFGTLVLSDHAHFFANSLLVSFPALLIFMFPVEKPSNESLLIYFSLFGFLTVLDRSLENIPCYYVFKLILFMLLYIPPYVLHEKIGQFISDQLNKKQTNENGTIHNQKTDSKPQPPTRAAISTLKPLLTSQKTLNNIEKETSKPSDPAPEPKHPSTLSHSYFGGGSHRMKTELNPMQSSSFYNLKSESESRVISPGNNLHDLMFSPFEKLVFNAPFDSDDLTYHMKIRNNSHHCIAFAVKGNAVPRVMANPVVGVLEKGEQIVVAVTVRKFIWNETDYEKDRIAFDYVLLPDDNKEKEFKMAMFQNSDTKRRKNIMIVYNP